MSQPSFPGGLNREDPSLTERQRRVFAALVALYGDLAHPVGSEALGARAGIPISPASIRSALAELEAMGLLERPHASAGRVPSARGYEVYVRTMVTPAALPVSLEAAVDQALLSCRRDIEHLLNEASRVLSTLTHELGLALATPLDDELLSALDLTPLDERRALLVLNIGGAAVRTLALQLESPLDRDELRPVQDVLRERLLGRRLSEVREGLASNATLAHDSAVRLVAEAAARSWAQAVTTPMFSAGAMHIAEHPEFARSATLGPILQVVEHGAPLDRLMVGSVEGQVAVRIGVDEHYALSACSLVSYALPGSVRGAIGVLGPLRMDYARVTAVVDAVGSRLCDLLS